MTSLNQNRQLKNKRVLLRSINIYHDSMETVELAVTMKGTYRVYAVPLDTSEEIAKALELESTETIEAKLEEMLKGLKIIAFSSDGSFVKISLLEATSKYKH